MGVCDGFVGNRMLAQRGREAQKLVMEGAMPWDIDRVLYDFGFPMGPFAMSDLAGLDIGWVKEKSSASTIREVLCENGPAGQKTGAGYYDYDENRNAKPSARHREDHQRLHRQVGRQSPQDFDDEEILERTLYPMVNEGAKILEEKKAIRPSDIDVVWENGYGWPVYSGGPMFWGDQVGLPKILAKLKEFEATMGEHVEAVGPTRNASSPRARASRTSSRAAVVFQPSKGRRVTHEKAVLPSSCWRRPICLPGDQKSLSPSAVHQLWDHRLVVADDAVVGHLRRSVRRRPC